MTKKANKFWLKSPHTQGGITLKKEHRKKIGIGVHNFHVLYFEKNKHIQTRKRSLTRNQLLN